MGFTDQGFNFHSQNFGLKVLKYALWRQVFTYFHRAIPPLNFETQEEKCVPISPLKCGYEVYGFNNPLNHKTVIYNLSVILSTRFAHLPLLCLWLLSWKPQCAETLKRSWVFIDHCVTLPSANLLGLSLPGKEGGREGGGKKGKTRREEGRGRENGKEGDREWGKEKVCVIFFNIGVRTFTQAIKIGFYFIKIANFFSPKDMINTEKQGTNWEKIFANTYLTKERPECKT